MKAPKPRMSLRDAMTFVPDDLPDGAYFAMAHEIAGMDYGEGFAEFGPRESAFKPSKKLRAKIAKHGELSQPDAYHFQVRRNGKLIADWWPTKRKFRIKGDAKATAAGRTNEEHAKLFLGALAKVKSE